VLDNVFKFGFVPDEICTVSDLYLLLNFDRVVESKQMLSQLNHCFPWETTENPWCDPWYDVHFCRSLSESGVKIRARNNILKTLTGTAWKQQKETIILTYQAIGRSVINYAAPVWALVINEFFWKCLQTAQNEALRIATGCHKMAYLYHLHQETKIHPVKSHSELLVINNIGYPVISHTIPAII